MCDLLLGAARAVPHRTGDRSARHLPCITAHRQQVALLLQVPFSGFGMMTRVVACIQVTRAIRTVAFMLTILPSSWPGCYARRFPPVPDSWWEFLRIGVGSLRSGGGCNDLVIR